MIPDQGIQCSVSITEDDVVRAMFALAWHGLARMSGILCGFAILLWVWDRSAWRPAGSLEPEIAGTITAAVLAPALYVYLLYGRARRAFKESNVYRNPLSYSFTQKGISVHGPTFTAQSDWANTARVQETKSLLILQPSTSAMTILPKRCFPDPSTLVNVRELIRQNVRGIVKLLS